LFLAYATSASDGFADLGPWSHPSASHGATIALLVRRSNCASPHLSTGRPTMDDQPHSDDNDREQIDVLRQFEDWLEMPMFVLSLGWVILLTVELTWGTMPGLELAVTVIWVVFLLEFAFKFIIAPQKLEFLRRNWLTELALLLPALRIFRVARVVHVLRVGRAIRGLTLARVLTAFNRGLRSLRTTMGHFGFSYVLMLTLLVTLLGAGGMYAFERQTVGASENGLQTFGDALWFTGMLMTTSGSDYWPRTAEGRVLCFLLALYAFAIFGYVTATLATVLIGKQQPHDRAPVDTTSLEALRAEIAALQARLEQCNSP
jgi:voltage-gated potassium channel